MIANDNKTVLDLQSHFAKTFDPEKSQERYNYCFPHDYRSSYINKASYPHQWNFQTYEDKMNKYEEMLRVNNKDDDDYKEDPEALEVFIQDEVRKYAKSLKEDYANEAERYINAFNYKNTLECLKTNENNKMFSSDTIGWTDYNYIINGDIAYHLKSNFGYGSSSYFFVNLKYKNIDILPYSDGIKYYHANMKDFIRYTRLYNLSRDCWNIALDFVTQTTNAALDDPDKFIKQWIFNEVREMMSGLRRIAEDPQTCHKEAANNNFAENGLISVRNITEYQRQLYKAYPDELVMAFQAEKITGALYFLEKLKPLEIIYKDIDKTINEIIDINKKLYPTFKVNLKRINTEIKSRKHILEKLKSEAEEIEGLCAPFLAEIQEIIKRTAKMSIPKSQNAIIDEFKVSHPKFAKLDNELSLLKHDIYKSESDIMF